LIFIFFSIYILPLISLLHFSTSAASLPPELHADGRSKVGGGVLPSL
jgi:hypothetical protein